MAGITVGKCCDFSCVSNETGQNYKKKNKCSIMRCNLGFYNYLFIIYISMMSHNYMEI